MKEPDFNQIDQWMMKVSKPVRDEVIPPRDLEKFHAAVMKKVSRQSQKGGSFQAPSFAMVFGLSLLFVFAVGGAYYLGKTSQPVPVVQGRGTVPDGNRPASIEPLQDENLLGEIAVLRELGVWTDDDEQAIGIPLDSLMQELDSYNPEVSTAPIQISGPIGR